MVSMISSQESSMSMARISTLAVIASKAEISAKSIAAEISSEESSSMTFSSSAVSMIECSSSTAASSSWTSSPFMPEVIRSTRETTIHVTGRKTIIRNLVMPEKLKA